MIFTESELRELWRDGRNALPAFPPGTRFTPAALDFLKDHRLTPVFEAAPAPRPAGAPVAIPQAPSSLLGRLDTLHALAGLVAAEARRANLPELPAHLDTLAAYCAELHAAAGQGRPAPSLAWGSDPAAASRARPGPHDHVVAHWLNYLRASAHEAEGVAPDTLRPALQRVTAAAEDLLARFLNGQLAWKPGG